MKTPVYDFASYCIAILGTTNLPKVAQEHGLQETTLRAWLAQQETAAVGDSTVPERWAPFQQQATAELLALIEPRF